MIGQIDIEKSLLNAPNDRSLFVAVASVVNSLVDAVNELTNCVGQLGVEFTEETKTPADPYAEQRKWIGCVCRFWYDNPNDTLLDYLDKIQTGKNGVEYYSKESGDWFPHCEPVKPDDEIIYKQQG